MKKEKALPKTLAQCADLLYQTREARLRQNKVVEELQRLETRLKDHIIETLPKSQASGVAGRVARVQLDTKSVPQVQEEAGGWDKFYAFVAKAKRFDLMQRRLNDAAVKEMWEAGKDVPGVGKFNVVTVSCTALKGGK